MATYPQAGTANDGKIVAVGTGSGDSGTYAVVRYGLNGTLDYSFGVRGQVTTKLGSSGSISARAVAVQPDGKVLAAGYPDLVRYNANGSLDTTFGKNGEVVLPFSAQAMSLQPDGKIVVAAYGKLALARYNANGSLDTSFGVGGTVTVPTAFPFDTAALALDPGTSPLDPNVGKIVASGSFDGHETVVRFNTTGSLDASFGAGGINPTSLSSAYGSPAVAVQSDGHIVVAATVATDNFGLVRLNPDGTPDATFGSGGFVAPPLPSTPEFARSVVIQPDGRIVVAGSTYGEVVLARYNAADGSLDTSFGNNGVAVAVVSSNKAIAGTSSMALEPDGRIVVAGTGGNPSGLTTFVARFLATGPQIGAFAASPNRVAAGSTVTLTAANVLPLNPGGRVTQVAFYVDSNGDGKLEPGTDTLLSYAVQTSPGTWSFTFSTTGWTSGSYTFFTQAEDNYGVFSDPLAVTVQVL